MKILQGLVHMKTSQQSEIFADFFKNWINFLKNYHNKIIISRRSIVFGNFFIRYNVFLVPKQGGEGGDEESWHSDREECDHEDYRVLNNSEETLILLFVNNPIGSPFVELEEKIGSCTEN